MLPRLEDTYLRLQKPIKGIHYIKKLNDALIFKIIA